MRDRDCDSALIHVISGKREEQETITGNKHYDTGYGLTRKYFKKREELSYKRKKIVKKHKF